MTDRELGVTLPEGAFEAQPVDVSYLEITGQDLHMSVRSELDAMNTDATHHTQFYAFRSILTNGVASGSMTKEQGAELAVLWMTDNPEDNSGHMESFLLEVSTGKA